MLMLKASIASLFITFNLVCVLGATINNGTIDKSVPSIRLNFTQIFKNGTTIGSKTISFIPPGLQVLLSKIKESENDYGHVEVRQGAFLFWWLYYADGTKEDAHKKPLVIWLQGGPSIPGSGLGNFVEIGPLTLSLKRRPYSWVRGKNLLLIDSPVGTGYSYVKDDSLYCKTDKDIAADLIQLVKKLLDEFPAFKKTPTHIFSQSYGTKVASYFAYYLNKDIERGEVALNLQTVALGGSWIDTRETSLQTTEFLYQTGFLDKQEYIEQKRNVMNLTGMIDRKEYREAYKYRLDMYTQDKSFGAYNIFNPSIDPIITKLTNFMNSLVSLALGPPALGRKWHFLNEKVMEALGSEFIKPSTHIIEKILNETNIRVVVYNGDLDSVTPMAGAVNWVHDLNWVGKEHFWQTKRQPLLGNLNGYFKEYHRLSLWWILRAGHWIPTDNPEAMEQILQYIVHENKEYFTLNSTKFGATTTL